ncbi:uncharacterized protein [Nothobranchius furzeri]|uniref:Apolipoprotein L domain containing 1 n=3 Tax=Nothobranchius TaxID=28779 RepID=A0A1A8A507_NOTFU|nr:putative LOC107376956-like protein [Nothobranchius furzeri]
MNGIRRDDGSSAAAAVVPPKPIEEELGNSITHSQNRQDPTVSQPQRLGVMGVVQKVNPFKSASKAASSSTVCKAPPSESLERAADPTQNPGMLKGVLQKVNPFKSTSQVSNKTPSAESLEQGNVPESARLPTSALAHPQEPAVPKEAANEPESQQNPGAMRGLIQKVSPFRSSQPKDLQPLHGDVSSSSRSLVDNSKVSEKENPGVLRGMMQKANPFRLNTKVAETNSSAPANKPEDGNSETSSSSESLDGGTIEKYTIWHADADASREVTSQTTEMPTFILKRILPTALFRSEKKEEKVEVQTLQLAEVPIPGEGTRLEPLDDEDGLLAWWGTVQGWDEWNQANQDDEAEEVVEQAADRVFLASRLFVRLFNQRGASLQQRILELLNLADAADNFHKKTVTASVGGGLASVAGSVTTITGLILAPFTAGTSLIVTAVGISIATAGGLTSASANITDTVHSKTDRKKVEKMIQDYQREIKDIKECLDFLQKGMETLEDWNFEKYTESISNKYLNQNVKHVMKEGGRAGKALVINTETLINTVQVLGVAGGAAKAAQAMSVTTGVMSGLFLALDMFFLAKDSMELKKGAKTEFAAKIREVCKDLQDGLLELNRIKEELQKTMEGIEVEVEEENEETLKSDLKKLKIKE